MKSITQLSKELCKIRLNQPYVTLEEARDQARQLKAAQKTGEKKRHLDCIGKEGCKASIETVQE